MSPVALMALPSAADTWSSVSAATLLSRFWSNCMVACQPIFHSSSASGQMEWRLIGVASQAVGRRRADLEAEHGMVFLGQLGPVHLPVHKDMPGVAGSQQAAVFRHPHFVVKDHDAGTSLFDPSLDEDLIVETGGRAVAATGLRHGEKDSVFAFHVSVVETTGFAQLDAAHFHPNQAIGVIDHTHLVGLGIAHADAGFGGWLHGRLQL